MDVALKGHSLVVDMVVLALYLDLMIFRVFSNLNYSIILRLIKPSDNFTQ